MADSAGIETGAREGQERGVAIGTERGRERGASSFGGTDILAVSRNGESPPASATGGGCGRNGSGAVGDVVIGAAAHGADLGSELENLEMGGSGSVDFNGHSRLSAGGVLQREIHDISVEFVVVGEIVDTLAIIASPGGQSDLTRDCGVDGVHIDTRGSGDASEHALGPLPLRRGDVGLGLGNTDDNLGSEAGISVALFVRVALGSQNAGGKLGAGGVGSAIGGEGATNNGGGFEAVHLVNFLWDTDQTVSRIEPQKTKIQMGESDRSSRG